MDSTTAGSEPFSVHLGTWTNWSRGPIFGATLTLTRSNGNLLIAFVAFFVALVGTRVWRMMCLIFHFAHSSKKPADALHCQRQAVFRNASTAESGLWSLVQIAWAWRLTVNGIWLRMLPDVLGALLCVVGFIVASGFSSQVATAVGSEVLLTSSQCGTLSMDLHQDLNAILNFWEPYATKKWLRSANYAQECYGEDSSGLMECGTFVQQKIPFKVISNASCPFAPGMCRTNDSNLILDTGYLDSNDHFGLNAPKDRRLQWRKVVHCAPLVTEGYKSTFNASPTQSFTRYHYGKSRVLTDAKDNLTYEYANGRQFPLNITSSPDYTISTMPAPLLNGSLWDYSTFEPIPALLPKDADLTIFFLSSNHIPFAAPTMDEWYRATQKDDTHNAVTTLGSDQSAPVYYQDEAASPMACLEWQQYCSPSMPKEHRCGALGPAADVLLHALPLVQDEADWNRLLWFKGIVTTSSSWLSDLIVYVRSQSLTSRYRSAAAIQAPLPNNQWQLEVQHWFASVLANLQQGFLRTALGPPSPDLNPWRASPENKQATQMCDSQKIKSTGYSSFSLFGLLFIFCLGGILIITSYAIEPILACLYRRRRHQDYAYLEWVSNSTLQIQRLAHQGIGSGTWSRSTDEVPITKRGDKLSQLDFTDPSLPLLRAANPPKRKVTKITDRDMEKAGFAMDVEKIDSAGDVEKVDFTVDVEKVDSAVDVKKVG